LAVLTKVARESTPEIDATPASLTEKRPAEPHVFAKGGHGFGMNNYSLSTELWIDEFYSWIQASGSLSPRSP